VPTTSNSYGVELSWQPSDRFVLGGWVGYTNTNSLAGGLFDLRNHAISRVKGSPWFFVVPKVTDSTISSANPDLDVDEDEDTSLHIEGFYQFQLTDNIAITPGFGLQHPTSTMTMMILSSVRSNDIHFLLEFFKNQPPQLVEKVFCVAVSI